MPSILNIAVMHSVFIVTATTGSIGTTASSNLCHQQCTKTNIPTSVVTTTLTSTTTTTTATTTSTTTMSTVLILVYWCCF